MKKHWSHILDYKYLVLDTIENFEKNISESIYHGKSISFEAVYFRKCYLYLYRQKIKRNM